MVNVPPEFGSCGVKNLNVGFFEFGVDGFNDFESFSFQNSSGITNSTECERLCELKNTCFGYFLNSSSNCSFIKEFNVLPGQVTNLEVNTNQTVLNLKYHSTAEPMGDDLRFKCTNWTGSTSLEYSVTSIINKKSTTIAARTQQPDFSGIFPLSDQKVALIEFKTCDIYACCGDSSFQLIKMLEPDMAKVAGKAEELALAINPLMSTGQAMGAASLAISTGTLKPAVRRALGKNVGNVVSGLNSDDMNSGDVKDVAGTVRTKMN